MSNQVTILQAFIALILLVGFTAIMAFIFIGILSLFDLRRAIKGATINHGIVNPRPGTVENNHGRLDTESCKAGAGEGGI